MVLVQSIITSSPVEWAIIIVCFLKDEKAMRVYGVADKPHYMDISNFPTSYCNPCRKDMWNVVCVVYGTTSGKSSLWVNHGTIRDFACRLPLRVSTLNLFNRVVYFDEMLKCTTTSSLFQLVSFLLE